MDYGKFRFEQQKKEKEQRKNQKRISMKEVRLSPTIWLNTTLTQNFVMLIKVCREKADKV